MTSAWVFAGGEFNVDELSADAISEADTIIGVDYGISHCLRLGLVPDILVGDFDSIDAAVLNDKRLVGVPRRRYPARKNSSDLELALHGLSETTVRRVVLLGISGGRSDHHLFNWLLPLQADWPFAVELIDHSVHAHLVSVDYPLLQVPAVIGQTVSILPMPEALGVTTQGLEYPLSGEALAHGSTLGLSNVADAIQISVSVSAGKLLVFRVKADTAKATE